MNRMKKHRVKEEKATASSSHNRSNEEHDLAYFIHDRVELMHQVFSVLKSKELKSFAPECVRRLSIDDLQELCLEELLGISSKRLCAILDGAEPPSDTESSSQSEQLETISLDSISSDDEILSQGSKKKKHKHRHSKKKRRKKSKDSDEDEAGESRASRAGLTVLELLELQARARAIRAQLHKEPARATEPSAEPPSSDNDEVLIKEEPAEVVEISSDEEKPDISRLQQGIGTSSQPNETETSKKNDDSQPVTKRINDLIITVPQSKPTRKIKLKRQKPAVTVTKEVTPTKVVEKAVEVSNTVNSAVTANVKKNESKKKVIDEAKNKAKKSKKKKKKVKEKEGSDQDEITIQLSDSEKMDLLEDLEAKNFDAVSSSDSDSSSTDSESDDGQNDDVKQAVENKDEPDNIENSKATTEVAAQIAENPKGEEQAKKDDEIRGYISNDNEGTVEINDLPVVTDEPVITKNVAIDKDESSDSKVGDKNCETKVDVSDETVEVPSADKASECGSNIKSGEKPESSSSLVTKSDGEISDRESSEVEASDVQPEVVCISDDEGKKKKKKKKEKKSKKEKRKSGFREEQDENFYKDKTERSLTNMMKTIDVVETIDDEDDVYEYLEISDDSSCYEVEGVSVLSKEPTAEEIEAFSARMDEIEIDTEETVIPSEDVRTESNETDDLENVSWKDRYLGSKKVKRVLTTSNILNAIRKKNRELKKKLEEAKKAEQAEKEAKEAEKQDVSTAEDGTIEQYETLEGSTKYVDPVKEIDDTQAPKEGEDMTKDKESEEVTREMKKDAKMLLKMYKRLLKYNDINKQKDPNKKKKKKQKKNKDKDKEKAKV